jgi:hypothetical protein
MNNFVKSKHSNNAYDWQHLSIGKIACIYHMAVNSMLSGNPLSHDIVHEIENFIHDKPEIDFMLQPHIHNVHTNSIELKK